MGFRRYDEQGNIVKGVSKPLDCQKAIEDGEEIRVEQSHKDEVNINNIVKRHGIDLLAKVAAMQQFTYDDVQGNDFQETMNAIIKAKESFASVPSEIRKQFDNDPAKFMDFVHNPDSKDQMVEWGLMKKEEVIPPQHVIIDNPPVTETPPEPPPGP